MSNAEEHRPGEGASLRRGNTSRHRPSLRRLRSISIRWALWLLVSASATVAAQTDTLTQYSTIDALMTGIYDGQLSIEQLQGYGDFGLGTFNHLDGEMLVLDGHVYQITADGLAQEPDPRVATPFAAVTFFETDRSFPLQPGMDLAGFKTWLDSQLPTRNIFYGVKISGTFKAVQTRSVPRQNKPYLPLKEVAKTQRLFQFENIRGTVVGFRSPQYVKGLSVPGYHLHFLTADKRSGGHVLELVISQAKVEIDDTPVFSVILPNDRAFYTADLSRDQQADVEKIERGPAGGSHREEHE